MPLQMNRVLPFLMLLAGCSHNTLSEAIAPEVFAPEAFGVTMVEETTCNGQGGRIVEGPDGAFCAFG